MNQQHPADHSNGIDPDVIKATLLTACDAAAAITLPVFRNKMDIANKEEQGFDPVTKGDREAELAIRAVIERQFPGHSIIGEEYPDKITDSPFSWVIDPIDGTRAFISGLPVWGTLIGLAYEGKTIAGIMAQPFTGETYLGVGTNASLCRQGVDKKLAVSGIRELGEAIAFTTSPKLFVGRQRAAFDLLEDRVRLARYGCDCYAFCLLASGHIDLVVEPGLKIYDIAALIPIVENAGGVITNFEGGRPDGGGDIIAAATPELHQAAMEIMGG